MDPDRWRQIESIFHRALDAGDSGRAGVLEEFCSGDEALRREVESLLAQHEKGEGFIEIPAFAASVSDLRLQDAEMGRSHLRRYHRLGRLARRQVPLTRPEAQSRRSGVCDSPTTGLRRSRAWRMSASRGKCDGFQGSTLLLTSPRFLPATPAPRKSTR